MATTTLNGFAPASTEVSSFALPAFVKTILNAIASSRIDAAARELRRHDALLRETALVHGDLRSIGLDKADLLPFNG